MAAETPARRPRAEGRPRQEADAGSQEPPADAAIWSEGLTKQYGTRRSVDRINLHVPVGALSGFVGPNGAGKTTTLRMLLGLIRPTEGRGFVLGHRIDAPARYLARVGAMIEGPTFHPGLTGRANLHLLARLRRLGPDRVAETLDMVGLTSRADDRFTSYSLGMKQRLGIAAALLPGPELLVLDEPTNGLDPAGIREIRSLLKDLAATRMTVFVSSHLLSEVEQICDHLVMIRGGRLLFQGHVTELLAAEDPRLVLTPEHRGDVHRLAVLLRDHGLRVDPVRESASGTVRVHAPEGVAASLNKIAMTAGITLRALTACRPTLEETFLMATGGVDGDLIPRSRTAPDATVGSGASGTAVSDISGQAS
ncbi:ATP-binding cassette domain-containing protein [Frankia sp. Cppng1_Ct_nod]|uniref:ATP-binding cassette domain-containing protein n=1 Tax=Frankia sp. Cppng1_Ct_nod TaxID=2897162 RepID=UPI001040F172|nr:ATP-binding cassette domain-containing protein [Frankia sp. Cppng1_Ct_nod]